MPLTSGARLGPYEILAPLGQGGMGARGHAERRIWRSDAKHPGQFALGVPPPLRFGDLAVAKQEPGAPAPVKRR